jgi:acetoacetyl-CoA synthetase
VRSGELSCSGLAVAVAAYDDEGRSIHDDVGELVIEKPLPSMPVEFWNDDDGSRLNRSYFERFAGVWHHGDWLCRFQDGAAVIYGRSDATLNRGGVRMGTSEFYRVVEGIPGVSDSLVVDTTSLDHPGRLWLFVVIEKGTDPASLNRAIKTELRRSLSPRHVPDVICEIDEVPYTSSGKKLEVPVKRLLMGAPLESTVTTGALRNPTAVADLLVRARDCQTKGDA